MRREPTTKLEVFGSFCPLTPGALVHQIGESNINTTTLIKPPRYEAKEDSVEMFALIADREHQKMLIQQQQTLHHNEQQVIHNENNTAFLGTSMAELRERLIDINIFMQMCDEKKRMAAKVIAKERQQHEILKKDTAWLKQQIGVMTKFREDLGKTIDSLEPYERVLKDTLDIQTVWTTAADCLPRCDALMLTQVEIMKMKADKINEMEEIRAKMAKLTSDAMTATLGLTTELNNVERDLIRARIICINLENSLADIKDCIAQQELNASMMMDAVDSLYKLVCLYNGDVPTISTEGHGTEKRLDYVKEEIEILQQVYKQCVAEMSRQEEVTLHRRH